MSNTIESKGRTVEEAISEALLRTGWRRDEVDVTVLEQPKGGILGLGRKPAKVRVERKGGERRGRGRRDDVRDTRLDAPRGDRRDGGRGEARGGRDRDRDRSRDQRGGRTAEARSQEGPAAEARGDQRGGEGRRDGGRGGRDRDRDRDQRRGRDHDRDRPRQETGATSPAATVEASANREPTGEEGGRSSSRRRRRRPTRQREDGRPETPGAAETPAILAEAVTEVSRAFEEIVPETEPAPVAYEPAAIPAAAAAAPTPEPMAAAVLDEARPAVDVTMPAGERVRPYGRMPARPAAEILQTVTTDLMRHAGFPCRCEVKEGEYDLVKLVVEDRSAQVLIGRYGAAVDAIEHLVEKISSQAAGDRVRMNLDVNNFRRRREEHLVQVARSVVREVRETGQPVHLDPLCARERRIIHLQVQDIPGMATYTVQDENGKHVVVATEDYVRAAAEAAGDAHLSHESDDHADDMHGEGVTGGDAGDRA